MRWLAFALGAAFLSAVAMVVRKKALEVESAVDFSTALALVNVLVSLPLFFWLDIQISVFLWFVIFLVGLTAAFGFLLMSKALKNMDVSVVSPMRNIEPAFIAFFAFLLVSEVLTFVHIAGISLLIVGSYILELDVKKHDLLAPFGEIIGSKYIHLLLGSLVIYSISAVLGKYVLGFTGPITLLFLSQFFVALVFLVYIKLFHDGLADIKRGFNQAGWLIGIIAVITVSYRLLQYNAMNIEYVSLVIPIKRLDTLFSTVMGGELFHEHGLPHKTVACVIMILGASLVVLG